jgi:2-polyprenyl-6-methoxyphenol hydroxylase-like FAD-dependent oxidoreductase
MYDTDVLVIGAGPTGLALAASLVARGVRTTVVDQQAAGANTSRAAARITALVCSDDLRMPTSVGQQLLT